MTDGSLDLGDIDPGSRQDWNDTWATAYQQTEARRRAFDEKVIQAQERYHRDPVFHAKVHAVASIFGNTRSHRILDSIRAVVAIEEIEQHGHQA